MCIAARKQLTGVWLALAAILIAQLNAPPPIGVSGASVKTGPTPEAEAIVGGALPILLECTLGALSAPGAMESVCFLYIFSEVKIF